MRNPPENDKAVWQFLFLTHLQHRWVCLCVLAAAELSVPSEWGYSGSRPQRDTDMRAPWTHIHSISNKPARDQPEWTGEQLRPPHITNLNCRSLTPQHNLQFNACCGLKSHSNHRYHIPICFSGSDIVKTQTEICQEFHKDREVRGRRIKHTQTHSEFTSSESPDITSAQSCFLLKALSSRWASPRVVTYSNGNHIHKCTRMQTETNAQERKRKKKYIKDDNPSAFASWLLSGRWFLQIPACFPPAAMTADVKYLII